MNARIGVLISTGLMLWMICAAGCKTTATSDGRLSFVTAAEAEQLMEGRRKLLGLGGKQTATYVDARSEADFRAGRIPGAVSLPFERVAADHRILKDYDVLIVYGNDYNDARANGMSKKLIELGHSDVRTLTGGMRAWKSAGNAVETD